jgi:hypothetical protein
MLLEAAPLACGAKVTVNVALCPAAMVAGNDSPPNVNSGLLELPAEIVTLAPVAVRVPVLLWLAPTVTFPKLRFPGATANCPGAVAVPLRDTVSVGTAPSAARKRLPLAVPLVEGVNTRLKVRLCPAFRVVGTFSPLIVNPAPVSVACEMLRTDPPGFVRVSERVCVLPTCTLPKLILVGLAARDPAVTPFPDSAMLSEGLEAVLAIMMLPFAFPPDVGAKVAVNVVF